MVVNCAVAQESMFRRLDFAMNLIDGSAPDSALVIADSIRIVALNTHNHTLVVKAMTTKGKALLYLKKHKDAVDLYFAALAICKSPEDNMELLSLYREVAYAYYTWGHYKESKGYYRKELELRRSIYGEDSLGKSLINLAVAHQFLKENDSSLLVLNNVAHILSRTDQPKLAGYYYLNRGALLDMMGNLDSASFFYTQAYNQWKALNNQNEVFKATFNLGFIAEEKKDYKTAIKYYRLSQAAVAKYGTTKDIAHLFGTMAEAYAYLHRYDSAYIYLHDYATISDSLNQAEFNTYIANLDKKFQAEKNKQVIQEQQQKLQTSNALVERQRSNLVLAVLVIIIISLSAISIFLYLSFKRRLEKKIEEAKKKFFENVVHEIRTPLSMIQAPLKILQGKVTEDNLQHQITIANRNIQRLNDLTTQMLDISKLDSNKYRLNESVGSLGDFFDNVCSQYEVLASQKNISFAKYVDSDPSLTVFDKDAIEKIIGNLLSNAINYTPQGGAIGIDVCLKNISNTHFVSVNVWDNGTGMVASEKEKIFSRFYRGEDERQISPGTGIGLSLVKDLVSLMNGTISVESQQGKGTNFTVLLPVKKQSQIPISTNPEDSRLILLVEDDKDILDFNKALLSENNYSVITAQNGTQALQLLKQRLPDIVITDVMMPEMDGLTLMRTMKNDPLYAGIPIVVLSARASAEARLAGMNEGAQIYLPKPFDPNELLITINNLFNTLHQQKEKYLQGLSQKEATLEERFSGSDPFAKKCFFAICDHIDDALFSVESLADVMAVNRSHLHRKIKSLTGHSPSELIRIIRLEKAKGMLQRKEGNITEIAYATGFTAQSYFTKCYSDHFGYPPSQEAAN